VLLSSGVVACVGAIIVIVFTIFNGLEYKGREDAGLQPAYASDWIVLGTNVGLWNFALAATVVFLTGVVALVRHIRRDVRYLRQPDSGTSTPQ
jgi:hypothetical protein